MYMFENCIFTIRATFIVVLRVNELQAKLDFGETTNRCDYSFLRWARAFIEELSQIVQVMRIMEDSL
jgi:hypothetical protein